jgi:hypothetical protein
LGISLVVPATRAIYVEALNDLHINSVGILATWVAALALVVTALVAFARKGRHAGWFHPLSLPFATLAVMSLGAALRVHSTYEAIGLLYDTSYQSAKASTLAVAVSAENPLSGSAFCGARRRRPGRPDRVASNNVSFGWR